MMLTSLLDVIRKKIKDKKPLDNMSSLASAVHEFLNIATNAEKFDFGLIPSELAEWEEFSDKTKLPMFRMPELTDDELQFWFDGMLPLPAPVCWYEFRVSPEEGLNSTSGLLIKQEDGEVWVQRIEYNSKASEDDFYMIDGTWVRLIDKFNLAWCNDDDYRRYQIGTLNQRQLYSLFGSSGLLGVYFTLMINSKSTEIKRVIPTTKQQSLRKQLRKTPLPEYTTVTIIPQRFIDEAIKDGDYVKGTHASPRLHWRRSHIRTYNRDLPNHYTKVIPRHIVGRRELGEVKHDYKVRIP